MDVFLIIDASSLLSYHYRPTTRFSRLRNHDINDAADGRRCQEVPGVQQRVERRESGCMGLCDGCRNVLR